MTGRRRSETIAKRRWTKTSFTKTRTTSSKCQPLPSKESTERTNAPPSSWQEAHRIRRWLRTWRCPCLTSRASSKRLTTDSNSKLRNKCNSSSRSLSSQATPRGTLPSRWTRAREIEASPLKTTRKTNSRRNWTRGWIRWFGARRCPRLRTPSQEQNEVLCEK